MTNNNIPDYLPSSKADRIIANPSEYASAHYLYIQEVGTLTSLRPHISKRSSLDSYLIMTVIQGSGTLTYRNNCIKLLPGDTVFINCLETYSHESSASDPWTLKWVHFNGREAADYYELFTQEASDIRFRASNPEAISSLIDRIHDLHRISSTHFELFTHQLLTDLLCSMIKAAGSAAHVTSGNIGTEAPASELISKLQTLREYLRSHYSEDLSLDLLSKISYISKYHLVREYRKAFGVTILEDITNCRLSQAKALLRYSNESIETIAQQCGFANAGYFIKVFRKHEHMTPRQYRTSW